MNTSTVSAKNKEEYDLETWQDVADIINSELDLTNSESVYRKWFRNFESGVEYGIKKYANNEAIQEMKDASIEIKKNESNFKQKRLSTTNFFVKSLELNC